MKMCETMKELMGSRDEFRQRLLVILHAEPMSINTMAKDISIARMTLRKFLYDNLCVDQKRMLKIQNYLIAKEQQALIPQEPVEPEIRMLLRSIGNSSNGLAEFVESVLGKKE